MSFRASRVTVDGTDVAYRETGAGPPVVLITGLGLSGRFYAPLAEGFAAAGLRLVIADPPGFGGTPGALWGQGVPDLAAFHAAFAEALALRAPVWVGHSLGAQVALRLAADHPHAARGLVLAAPSGGPARLLRLRQLAGLGLTAFRVPPATALATLREYARNNPLRVAGTWLRGAADDPTAHAPRVAAPTLILVGNRDPVPGQRYLDLLRQRLPDARFEMVPGATHALPRDEPKAFVASVAGFVRSLPP